MKSTSGGDGWPRSQPSLPVGVEPLPEVGRAHTGHSNPSKSADRALGAGGQQLARGVGGGEADDAHAGAAGGVHAHYRVLEDQAARGGSPSPSAARR